MTDSQVEAQVENNAEGVQKINLIQKRSLHIL